MNACFDGVIFHFEVCSHKLERKQLRVPKNMYIIIQLKNDTFIPKHIISNIYN